MRKFIDALKSIVEAIKNYLKNGDVNHRIAAQLAQDVEALEQYEKLWVDALKVAVKNNAEMQSNAKENTDTESSGGKYSLTEKELIADVKKRGKAQYIDFMSRREYNNYTEFYIDDKYEYVSVCSTIRMQFKDADYKDKYVECDISHSEYVYNVIYNNPAEFKIIGKTYIEDFDEEYDNAYTDSEGTYKRDEKDTKHRDDHYEKMDGNIRNGREQEEIYGVSKEESESEDSRSGQDSLSDSRKGLLQQKSKLKFSLSEPVEEKGNLIAVHNIYTDKLIKSLKLGGFPMPSIAVTKADMGHGKYGEISFVFDKSTIDPKDNKANKVYGCDAWTPTYPDIEYKVNDKTSQIKRKSLTPIAPTRYAFRSFSFHNESIKIRCESSSIEKSILK